jgi:hypothetical protein
LLEEFTEKPKVDLISTFDYLSNKENEIHRFKEHISDIQERAYKSYYGLKTILLAGNHKIKQMYELTQKVLIKDSDSDSDQETIFQKMKRRHIPKIEVVKFHRDSFKESTKNIGLSPFYRGAASDLKTTLLPSAADTGKQKKKRKYGNIKNDLISTDAALVGIA